VRALADYDLYSRALAKIERGHRQDLTTSRGWSRRGVDKGRLRAHFETIEPILYRFPAIDPESFRRAVARVVSGGQTS
jgi:hypothetical protein